MCTPTPHFSPYRSGSSSSFFHPENPPVGEGGGAGYHTVRASTWKRMTGCRRYPSCSPAPALAPLTILLLSGARFLSLASSGCNSMLPLLLLHHYPAAVSSLCVASAHGSISPSIVRVSCACFVDALLVRPCWVSAGSELAL